MDEYLESGWREKCEGLRGEDNGGLRIGMGLYIILLLLLLD